MDTLVTKYSKPAYERTAALEDDASQELTDPWASLSLKFAMPPITQVCLVCTAKSVQLLSLFQKRKKKHPLTSQS